MAQSLVNLQDVHVQEWKAEWFFAGITKTCKAFVTVDLGQASWTVSDGDLTSPSQTGKFSCESSTLYRTWCRIIQRWLERCAINIMYFFFSQVSYCFDNCNAFAFLAVVCCFWINDADTLGSLITNKTVLRVEFDTQLRSFYVFALITGTPIESCSRQCWWRWPWVTEVAKRSRWVECFETMLRRRVSDVYGRCYWLIICTIQS